VGSGELSGKNEDAMQDKELYQQILGLESAWRVVGVSLDVRKQEIVVPVTSQNNLTEKEAQPVRCCVQPAAGDRQGLGLQGVAAGTLGPVRSRGLDSLVQGLVPTPDPHAAQPFKEGRPHDPRPAAKRGQLLYPWDQTNGVAEGINSEIQSIKRRVGGIRNPENFRDAIFFYCGGLDLPPCQ
jgi:hypothetical protein